MCASRRDQIALDSTFLAHLDSLVGGIYVEINSGLKYVNERAWQAVITAFSMGSYVVNLLSYSKMNDRIRLNQDVKN